MDRFQKNNCKNNTVITTLFEESTNFNAITLKQPKTKKNKHKATVYSIFQNTPIINEGHRLVISPGHIILEGIGSCKKIDVREFSQATQFQELPDINLISENPKIISISNQEITATQIGSTILSVEKNGLGDSIRVDVKT